MYVEALKKAVDAHGCEKCGPEDKHNHEELVLSARCHPGKGVDVVFKKETEAVYVFCHECRTPVVDIAVAHKPIN